MNRADKIGDGLAKLNAVMEFVGIPQKEVKTAAPEVFFCANCDRELAASELNGEFCAKCNHYYSPFVVEECDKCEGTGEVEVFCGNTGCSNEEAAWEAGRTRTEECDKCEGYKKVRVLDDGVETLPYKD